MVARSNVLLLLAVVAGAAVLASAGPAPVKKPQIYRHYFFYKGAPKNASSVRVALFTAWNKANPTSKVIYNVQSWQDPADQVDAAGLAKYPYNWGGFFDFKDRATWKAYDSWQKTQVSYNATFASFKDVVRFHALI